MEDGRPKYRRQLKNIILNPKFQFKFIATMTLGALILTLCYNYIFYNFIQDHYYTLLKHSSLDPVFRREVVTQMGSIYFYLTMISVLFCVAMVIWALIVSHQIIGPMYKMKKIFNNIINDTGDKRVYLRKHDQFHDVAFAFNDLMEHLENQDK